ncbi:hypothetical protein HDU79_009847 [Rhizoclosmatium sp. JEL0117]|nr:hypothetical protein HDU79_009847 [Rhizoclosmatium sp. JEL0117]
MPLRPGTTGRVLPFPASLVRDDVRLDAYVELSTVASLPDLSAPPEPPTPSNPAADLLSPTQQQAQSQTLKPLAPSKPRSRAPSFFVPPLKTKSVSDDPTAPEEVVDEAPAKIIPFPYKLPDLFMNMIRRKRQLEYEAKHPEKLHTRIVVADYSRAVHKKPIALAADISVTEVVPSSSRVSVTSKDGKGGAKWKKKRETTRASKVSGPGAGAEKIDKIAKSPQFLSLGEGKSTRRVSIWENVDEEGKGEGKSSTTPRNSEPKHRSSISSSSKQENNSTELLSVTSTLSSRAKSVIKLQSVLRRPSMMPKMNAESAHNIMEANSSISPTLPIPHPALTSAVSAGSIFTKTPSTDGLFRLQINTSHPTSSVNLLGSNSPRQQSQIISNPLPRFNLSSRYNFRTPPNPFTTTVVTPTGKRVRIVNVPNPDTPFRKLQTQELDLLHSFLLERGETSISRDLLSRAFYIPMEIAKPSINVTQVLRGFGLTRTLSHRRRTPLVDSEDEEVLDQIYHGTYKTRRGKGILPTHKVAVVPKTVPDDDEVVDSIAPRTLTWWSAAEYRNLRGGWEERKMKRVKELLVAEQGKRLVKEPFNSFVKSRAVTPSKNTKHTKRFDLGTGAVGKEVDDLPVNWFPTPPSSRRRRAVKVTPNFVVPGSNKAEEGISEVIFGGDGWSRSTTPAGIPIHPEILHVQQSYSKYKPGVL